MTPAPLASVAAAGVRCDPAECARALLRERDVQAPHEIAVELIAYDAGAVVTWRETGAADARVVRAGAGARIAVARRSMGTPRGRYSIAHELGHYLLHPDCDAVMRVHLAARMMGTEHKLEREANVFASELLVPAHLAIPMCADATPSLDAVSGLARVFDVSLTVAAMKWAALAQRGCAFVESRGDVIKRVVRSGGFRGEAMLRRALAEGSLALETARGGDGGARLHVGDRGGQWGSLWAGRDIVEECMAIGDGKVLTWLWHE